MKKIVFNNMLLQPMSKAIYSAQQKEIHSKSSYKEPVYFPINAKLANELEKDDDVKIVTLRFIDSRNPDNKSNFEKNYSLFKDELDKINKDICANIKYEIFDTDFEETRDIFADRFIGLYDLLEQDCKIYADVTFGPKTASFILMDLLSFADKFFDADIDSIVYGQTSMVKSGPTDGKVCDITTLYYLNGITNSLVASSGEEARKALKVFFGK